MTKFPPEIWEQIFQYMNLETKKQTRLVCTHWEKILQNKKTMGKLLSSNHKETTSWIRTKYKINLRN